MQGLPASLVVIGTQKAPTTGKLMHWAVIVQPPENAGVQALPEALGVPAQLPSAVQMSWVVQSFESSHDCWAGIPRGTPALTPTSRSVASHVRVRVAQFVSLHVL